MLNTLVTYETLKAAEMPEPQARAITVVAEKMETEIVNEFKLALRSELGAFRLEFDAKLSDTKADLIRWMFVFWTGNFIATVALIKMLR
jgi:hypothetical protein